MTTPVIDTTEETIEQSTVVEPELLGLLLVLDHGGGYLSLYGHNQDLSREVGDRVSAGDLLAHVGDTGGQARPALYYEVRRNGRPVNPRQWGN